jgi:hypothetical protein
MSLLLAKRHIARTIRRMVSDYGSESLRTIPNAEHLFNQMVKAAPRGDDPRYDQETVKAKLKAFEEHRDQLIEFTRDQIALLNLSELGTYQTSLALILMYLKTELLDTGFTYLDDPCSEPAKIIYELIAELRIAVEEEGPDDGYEVAIATYVKHYDRLVAFLHEIQEVVRKYHTI